MLLQIGSLDLVILRKFSSGICTRTSRNRKHWMIVGISSLNKDAIMRLTRSSSSVILEAIWLLQLMLARIPIHISWEEIKRQQNTSSHWNLSYCQTRGFATVYYGFNQRHSIKFVEAGYNILICCHVPQETEVRFKFVIQFNRFCFSSICRILWQFLK